MWSINISNVVEFLVIYLLFFLLPKKKQIFIGWIYGSKLFLMVSCNKSGVSSVLTVDKNSLL